GLGSRTPIPTRSTPARTSASAHGPVRPTWLHGSSVTYTVAPRALPSSLASASASACAPPGGWVKPVASTFPARTITAPTGGLGRVRPRARSARRKAWCMNLTSSLLLTRKRVEQRDALLVAAAGERRGEERLERLLGDRAADQPLAEADDVGVVVLARQARRGRLRHQRRAHARHLVGRHRDADARAAHRHAARVAQLDDFFSDGGAELGIVDRLDGVGADVDHLVAPRRQQRLQVFL